jgi:hypothetical protein
MDTTMIKRNVFRSAVLCTIVPLMLFAFGCRQKQDPKPQLEAAINHYHGVHPLCIWQEPKKFPIQAATADEAKTEGLDALTDAGLLKRTTAEKQRFLIGSKQVNNYDLSDKGRSAWTQDTTQPGYGNFCYGHLHVTSIDNFTTAVNASGMKTAHVNFHVEVGDAPDWAKSQEVQTAFPEMRQNLAASHPAQADLVNRGGHWHVTH